MISNLERIGHSTRATATNHIVDVKRDVYALKTGFDIID